MLHRRNSALSGITGCWTGTGTGTGTTDDIGTGCTTVPTTTSRPTCASASSQPSIFTSAYTGKSLSEALIFASNNPQYDNIVFIELQVQYMKISSSEHGENMLCTEIVFGIQGNFCTQHVLPMFCKNKKFWQRFTCK